MDKVKEFKDYLQKNKLQGDFQYQSKDGIGYFKGFFLQGKKKKYYNIIMFPGAVVQAVYTLGNFKDYINTEDVLQCVNSLNISTRGARYFMDDDENICVLYEDIYFDKEFSPKELIKQASSKFKEAIKQVDDLQDVIKIFHERKEKLKDVNLN